MRAHSFLIRIEVMNRVAPTDAECGLDSYYCRHRLGRHVEL